MTALARRALLLLLLVAMTGCGWCTPPPKTPPLSPGIDAPPLPADVGRAIAERWRARDEAPPRTRHRQPDGTPTYANRLLLSSSPYLLQHAHNPVGWFPWGEEAFALARQLGRPVFLSVGYSTCHWCHVMEEESFEDEDIARVLNTRYIPIKVDREERPDVDSLYMTAVRRLTGRGGWPMSVWLNDEGEPFFAGTYFPARDGDRGVRTGLLTLLTVMADRYASDPGVATRADAIAAELKRDLSRPAAVGDVDLDGTIKRALEHYRQAFDPQWGGLSRPQKFPSSLPLRWLMRVARRSKDAEVAQMVTLTLDQMDAGGLHDHLGGGFHRYSVDARWEVPHFEKMLYDNALLALTYTEAWQLTGRGRYREIAEDTLAYLERDMSTASGGFASATDADSPVPANKASPDAGVDAPLEREEGWYFTWTPSELKRVLDPLTASAVMLYFGVTQAGNFEGRSIFTRRKPHAEVAQLLGLTPAELTRVITGARATLLAHRQQRPPPLRDDKVIAGWNGLAVAALARAGFAFDNKTLIDRAARVANHLWTRQRDGDRLRRAFIDGRAYGEAVLDDYAFVTWGLLALFEASGEAKWLERALALDAVVAAHFEDPAGGFFLTADDAPALLARERSVEDNAIPSGASVQVMNLLRLYELTLDERYRLRAEKAVRATADALTHRPMAVAELLLALDWMSDAAKEVVVVNGSQPADTEALVAPVRSVFVPNRVWVTTTADSQLVGTVPLVQGKIARDGKATAYVCVRNVCREPTTDAARLMLQLSEATPYAWMADKAQSR